MTTGQHTPASADPYDRSYYLDHMEGANEFARTQGQGMSLRLEYALQLARVQPEQRVLDLGCGRGEVAWQCANRGARAHGLDFSLAALTISRELRSRAVERGLRLDLERANVCRLPFANDCFDAILMFDLVEHLHSEELRDALIEAGRVLRRGGRLIIHTMPNSDYYRWGYPWYRLLMRVAGKKLPRDPRLRWYGGETHVNIQNPRSLGRALRASGFDSRRVWLHPLNESARLRTVLSIYPIRWILCNDILAVAVKQ